MPGARNASLPSSVSFLCQFDEAENSSNFRHLVFAFRPCENNFNLRKRVYYATTLYTPREVHGNLISSLTQRDQSEIL